MKFWEGKCCDSRDSENWIEEREIKEGREFCRKVKKEKKENKYLDSWDWTIWETSAPDKVEVEVVITSMDMEEKKSIANPKQLWMNDK